MLVVMSGSLGLGLEKPLVISAIRCVVQLTLMVSITLIKMRERNIVCDILIDCKKAFVLEDVFEAKHPAIIILMACKYLETSSLGLAYQHS